MKILVLVLIIAFVWLLISYVGVLVRLHRIGGELEAIKKYLVEIVLENNDRNNVFQKILEYIGASSQCITDIANEIEKITGNTAWMDGIDTTIGSSLNIDKDERV